jgi:cytochrome P450
MTLPAVNVRSDEFLDAPAECLAHIRQQAGVCPTSPDGWMLVTRYDLVKQIMLDPETYSSRVSKHTEPPAEAAEEIAAIRAQGWPYTSALGRSDAPEHTKHRKMVNKAFTPRALQSLEPLVRQAAEDLANALPDGVEIDFQAEFGEPLPVWAISKVLGLPMERRNDIRRWSTAAVSSIGSNPSPEQWVKFEEDLLDYQLAMKAVLDANLDDPQPGVIADLAQAIADEDTAEGEGVQMSLLLTLLRELVVAGNETTGKFIAEAIRIFGTDESVWERIRENPDFAVVVVEEALRLSSPTQSIMRITTKDVVLDGVAIAKGTQIMASLASANRDEIIYDESSRFDPDRENVRQHLAFGSGAHMCIGAGLARMESVIALQVLAEQVTSIVASSETGPYSRSFIIRGPLELRATVHRR